MRLFSSQSFVEWPEATRAPVPSRRHSFMIPHARSVGLGVQGDLDRRRSTNIWLLGWRKYRSRHFSCVSRCAANSQGGFQRWPYGLHSVVAREFESNTCVPVCC